MNTSNLNKTNLAFKGDVNEIEKFLGREIDAVYNYKNSFERGRFVIHPGSVIFQNNYPCKGFKPFTMVNTDYKFDFTTGIMTVRGRDKWQRSMTTKRFQLEKVGYKLPTTSIQEGFIFGNPKEIL